MRLFAAASVVILLITTHHTAASTLPRRTLHELFGDAVAGVPRGYLRVGHRDNGYSLTETRAAGDQGHETVMFTAEGGVFTKTVTDSSQLPRRLSEVGTAQTYAADASGTSVSLNPKLACATCPATDTRTLVQDTTIIPWDAIGLLARQDATSLAAGISQCSGAIIGPQKQHVLTAGHCLVDASSNNSDNVNKITFYAALNGQKLPFGTLTAAKARVLKQYVAERSTTPFALNYDFALITLSAPAPSGTSYLDFAAGTGTQTYNLTTAGYPADKNQDVSGSFMYEVECPNVKFDYTNGPSQLMCGDRCNNMVVHDCLSYEGQSGSAIWSTEGQNRTIRAILTGAIQESDGPLYNVGTALNSFVYNTIVGWYNEDVTAGLPLAPPAPPGRAGNDNGLTSTLGNQSWWHSNWWYIVLPVGACLVIGLLFLMCSCCKSAMNRKSRPMVGATHPPVIGGGYPQQYQPQQPPPGVGNGFPTQAYNNQQAAARSPAANSNYSRYGPSYYNGTSGYQEGYPS